MSKSFIAALAWAGLAMAQQVPSGWKAVKSEKGTCQVSVPADWTVDDFRMAKDPKKVFSLMILHAQDAKMDPPEYRLVAYSPIKVFENTSKRVVLEDKTSRPGPGWPDPGRKFVGFAPHATKGICQAILNVKAGGPEELAKQVVSTVSPAR